MKFVKITALLALATAAVFSLNGCAAKGSADSSGVSASTTTSTMRSSK